MEKIKKKEETLYLKTKAPWLNFDLVKYITNK